MSLLLITQQAVFTLVLAASYAFFAAGFVLIFGVLDVLNLAHAFVFMFAATTAVWASQVFGLNLLVAIVIAIAIGTALGFLLDRVAFRPLDRRQATVRGGVNFGPLISTLGIAAVLEGLARQFYGVLNQSFPPESFPTTAWTIGGIRVALYQVFIVGMALVILLALRHLLAKTTTGQAIRAVAENRDMAGLVGINDGRIITFVWMLSSALAGVAGVFIGLAYRSVSPTMGLSFELKGIIVVILGGLGSVSGALVAALLLAVMETYTTLFIGGSSRDMIVLGVIVALLLLRPQGLFGVRTRVV